MRKLTVLTGVMLLSACSLYEKPEVPALEVPDDFKVELNFTNPYLKNEWWENFNDETLNALVEQALEENYNYQVALNNIDIAQTYVAQNRSYLFPQVGAGFNASRNKFVPDEFFGAFSTPTAPPPLDPGAQAKSATPSSSAASNSSSSFINGGIFDVNMVSAYASYELDVWNQIRNSVKQAAAVVRVNEAESDVIKLTLVSNVVNTYFQLMALYANRDNLTEQHHAALSLMQLVEVQNRSGLIDASSLYNAQIQAESILIALQQIKKQQQILEYMLAYLLGEYPEDFAIKPHNHFNTLPYTELIPEGIPAQMLALRPDIQSAYFQVISYGYLEKQALANFLPTFTLTGGYGYASSTFSNLINNSNAFWDYGLGISQYVFDYAVRESQYDRAGEQFESSILSYQNTVLNAFLEVNTALVSYQEDAIALDAIKKQKQQNTELFSISDAQYQAGLVNYTVYLTNELNLLQSEYNLVNQQLMVTQDIIQIYKALGLGLES